MNTQPAATAQTRWPLRSYLELGALPTAVGCARLHSKQVLWEWGLAGLSETVELLVSEIVTNAVRASAALAALPHDGRRAGVPAVQLRLSADRQRVLIQVWDGNDQKPARKSADLEAESGRGLLLVETLSAQWGCYVPEGRLGKVVWCMVEAP
jgi:anti-sigma regulatory factor (Ser/Thr protein kinase)